MILSSMVHKWLIKQTYHVFIERHLSQDTPFMDDPKQMLLNHHWEPRAMQLLKRGSQRHFNLLRWVSKSQHCRTLGKNEAFRMIRLIGLLLCCPQFHLIHLHICPCCQSCHRYVLWASLTCFRRIIYQYKLRCLPFHQHLLVMAQW